MKSLLTQSHSLSSNRSDSEPMFIDSEPFDRDKHSNKRKRSFEEFQLKDIENDPQFTDGIHPTTENSSRTRLKKQARTRSLHIVAQLTPTVEAAGPKLPH
uniref:Uncharacterized protein n=1 Tax=Nelumbo nucifera TaxID=4432 RepID=A0A822ZJL9_NELNU|nr:TPA_asm: hypothetical protein HUJ06_001799 [Nelumbo nucifera]